MRAYHVCAVWGDNCCGDPLFSTLDAAVGYIEGLGRGSVKLLESPRSGWFGGKVPIWMTGVPDDNGDVILIVQVEVLP